MLPPISIDHPEKIIHPLLVFILMLLLLFGDVAAQDTAMNSKKNTLQTVTVTGRKAAIERRPDRTILNVEAFLSNAGSNALELLERAPGVLVINDIISIKGRSQAAVYIDDKPLYLQGSALADYLKSLPAASIASIEILPNPPAQYDAAGAGGIIVFRMKRSNARGFSGNIVSENIRGRKTRLMQTMNLSWRSNKLYLYTNASNYDGAGFSQIRWQREFIPGKTDWPILSFNQNSYRLAEIHEPYLKLGMEWQATPKNFFSFAASGSLRRNNNHTQTDARKNFIRPEEDSIIAASSSNRRRVSNLLVHAGLRHLFDTAGHELILDVDYIRFNTAFNVFNTAETSNARYEKISWDQLNGDLPSDIRIWSFRADYKYPLSAKSSIEAGVKSAGTTVETAATYDIMLNADHQHLNRTGFNYREWIHAAYVNSKTRFGKFSVQAGLRAEYTNTSLRKYTNLFPSVFLGWKPTVLSKHQFQLSWSNRISRPDYADLNPAAAPYDRFQYRIGNPLLQPRLADNIELGYTFNNAYSLSVFYNRSRRDMDELRYIKNDIYYSMPVNAGKKQSAGFTIDATTEFCKWYTSISNILYTHSNGITILPDQTLHVRGGTWNFTTTHQFRFSKGWSGEITGNYVSSQPALQYIQQPSWYVHAGIGKKILQDKGAIKLNFRDIFYTRVDQQQMLNYSYMHINVNRRWDTRSVTLLFSYRFGKETKADRRKERSAPEERNRLPGEQ
ncbi:TonB-dependent receptor [Pseudoflavitalea sp. G-6-1-2]|uniref:outer membrane beta-barrel protein n=1 Tax=Pseudoflavitalea sp. G-6-1-2 TaxID=2728841 RepID=UPI00146B6DC6|nr:outer membrane beta-barrel protein [Pseudoflavitalea sp. G-6-1-2]NML23808.1 TonB-dependent receptor [Pseudoflavitalea sp. G-6-1-2]